MRNIILLLILVSELAFGQSPLKFQLEENGITNYIVTNVENKNASEIYQSSLAWIKKNYNHPDSVIITTVENDYIKFKGLKKDLYCINAFGRSCNDVRYTIELSFKDDKYKMNLIELEFYSKSCEFCPSPGWKNLMGLSSKIKYNKKGKEISAYKFIDEVPEYFNFLNNDLKNYILGNSIQNNKDW